MLAWPALAAGAVAAGGQVARGRRLRERQVVAIGIIGGLSRLIGPRNVDIDVQRTRGVAASSWVMDRRTVVMRQWTRGRASVPARIEIRYHPAIDAGAAWQGEVLRVLEGKTGHRYQVAGVYPRRRLLSLRLDPSPAPQQEMVTPAQARLQRGVATLIGPTARTGDVVLDGEGQIVGFRITHDVGAKLAARGYRIRVEKTLETMLPGRWRAHWDLEGDTVRFEVRPALPRQVWMPIPAPLDTADVRGIRIPYAVDEDGHEIAWLPGKVPHFLITGQTGAGKTSTARAVIAGVTRHGWPIWIADVKRIEFRDFRDWPNVQAVATGIEQIVAMIHAAHQVMSGRYQLVERGAARPSDFEPLFVFIDEYTEFINLLRSWYATVKIKGDPSVPRTLDEVASLLRLGRTGRVHLVITGQRPDVALFGTGEMRDNLGQRASMGRLSPKGAEMMWESASTGVSIPRGLIGRMTTTNDDGLPVEAQAYRFPDFDAPDGSEETQLLQQLRPTQAVHERLLILPAQPVGESEVVTWAAYANAPWVRASDRPDLDPLLASTVDDTFDATTAGSTLAMLGLTGCTPGLLPPTVNGPAAQPAPTTGSGPAATEEVDLLLEAAELVVTSQYASTAMLQRKLRIGFAKAGTIMDQLQTAGIVGPQDASKSRQVLTGPDDLADAISFLRGDTETGAEQDESAPPEQPPRPPPRRPASGRCGWCHPPQCSSMTSPNSRRVTGTARK